VETHVVISAKVFFWLRTKYFLMIWNNEGKLYCLKLQRAGAIVRFFPSLRLV
jgi:hypothetical protein